jgi:hypothetical protein
MAEWKERNEMSTQTRRAVVIGSTVVVALFLACAGVWYELTHYRRAYEQLTRGTAKADVLKRFGKPGRVTDCRFESQSWDGGPEEFPKTCVELFEYFSNHSIDGWEIGFDKDGRVVSKAYLQSP